MRLFVAIEVPASILPHIEELQFKLRGRGLVRARQPHLTLAFIGEAEPEPITRALSAIEFSPFELTIQGIDFFPTVSQPNVVYLGVKRSSALEDLAAKVREALPSFKDDHPFHGHITLFRLRRGLHKANLKARVRHIKVKDITFPVDSFVLKRSVLTQKGPEHSDVARFSAKDL